MTVPDPSTTPVVSGTRPAPGTSVARSVGATIALVVVLTVALVGIVAMPSSGDAVESTVARTVVARGVPAVAAPSSSRSGATNAVGHGRGGTATAAHRPGTLRTIVTRVASAGSLRVRASRAVVVLLVVLLALLARALPLGPSVRRGGAERVGPSARHARPSLGRAPPVL
jgi:hypothetical protein